MNEFAKQLKELLTKKGISQGELARRSDLSTTHISNIMNGRRLPTNDTMLNIAKALGLGPKQTSKLAMSLGHARYPASKRAA